MFAPCFAPKREAAAATATAVEPPTTAAVHSSAAVDKEVRPFRADTSTLADLRLDGQIQLAKRSAVYRLGAAPAPVTESPNMARLNKSVDRLTETLSNVSFREEAVAASATATASASVPSSSRSHAKLGASASMRKPEPSKLLASHQFMNHPNTQARLKALLRGEKAVLREKDMDRIITAARLTHAQFYSHNYSWEQFRDNLCASLRVGKDTGNHVISPVHPKLMDSLSARSPEHISAFVDSAREVYKEKFAGKMDWHNYTEQMARSMPAQV